MFRQDYILRMIEEFARRLARITALRKGGEWEAAERAIDEEFKELLGAQSKGIAELSETELLALILQGGGGLRVRDRTLLTVAFLKEAADVADGSGRDSVRDELLLRALFLLLNLIGRGDYSECPQFVPTVECLLEGLAGRPLPLHTQALLMQHFDRAGDFGKAEDFLFGMLERAPEDADLIQLGLDFYDRLLALNDETLAAGNLPRAEIESAANELRERLSGRRPKRLSEE